MTATYQPYQQEKGGGVRLLALTSLILMALVAIAFTMLTLDIDGPGAGMTDIDGFPDPCGEIGLIQCWEGPNSVKAVDTYKRSDGRYQVDVYHYINDEWKLITSMDDLVSLEEVNSYLSSRGFTLIMP